MGDLTADEVLIALFLCLGTTSGAAYGWLAVGTVSATVGGAVLVGTFALLLVSVISIALEGIARLFRRGGDG